MLAMDVIEPAQTEWASSTVFVPKKDVSFPLCVDYCKWNAVTIQDLYSIPGLKECIDPHEDEMIL